MDKLLVPVDGSGAALRALDQAIALARLSPGCSIHLVHAHEEPPMDELQREHSEGVLAAAEDKLKNARLAYTREVLVGPIAETLAAHAERLGCDAIVMGRHGKTTLGHVLVGSVAMKVLQVSKLPALLVR